MHAEVTSLSTLGRRPGSLAVGMRRNVSPGQGGALALEPCPWPDGSDLEKVALHPCLPALRLGVSVMGLRWYRVELSSHLDPAGETPDGRQGFAPPGPEG